MVRILDFGGREADRTVTVASLRALKNSGTRLVQVTAGTAEEAAAAEAARAEPLPSLTFQRVEGLVAGAAIAVATGVASDEASEGGGDAELRQQHQEELEAAALLAEPSQAAGVLDAVGDDGFSALLWAEERGLRSVAQKLRECGAAAVRRPALSLFRGECGAVQIKVSERTVAFAHSFVTVRSAQRCPLGAKGYYELEILDRDDLNPQYGFASPAFERVLGASEEGVGDDEHSWAVDGARQCKWHNGNEAYPCTWNVGDVIGLACDLDAMQMHVSVNGSFAAPNGAVFELDPDAVHDGLFAAFSGVSGKVRYNFGEAPFQHAPPAADYQAFAAFEA